MKVRLCPSCGSGKLTEGQERVTCTNCSWEGEEKDAIVAHYKKPGVDEALSAAEEVAAAYFVGLSKHAAMGIGMALVESGIVGRRDKPTLTRLIKVACLGAYKATLDAVTSMQTESKNGRRDVH